ncbi:malonyl CoA-acyl carrier protein transacylase FabD [Thermoclostridium stercorarium subsp. stercorarium DSM 8532]|uniref:Malonyl CoA-acyl carrier protein transacylase n=1 Tax=Thermoclostridium stercorarium (strain ATCC 35414 / DSM 8532 / NCIMB 11754) TaxID=1121335 RepID=L7VJC0_THES1|nr:ACP S-malonyltransferase [Thermoclostridium stercorarium]AGC68150.1 malonyl CoA-acyl carrier protein transacylase FabD [Thermoclostridium stercorarium subsp. stercorarium DSM 8532]AGI39176.1 acyl-carrier-protein S-malonyltransferase [Thermoclostridium stercorarium subsp. stercorarium DSM 8532]
MGKIAFIFPGQGSQYVGMAKEICDHFPEAAEIFHEASEALGFDIGKMVFDGDEETLKITENTQPAIVTVSIACLQPLLIEGIQADFTAGLSLGEYAAHVYSGTFLFRDAVRLLKLRGRFMQEAVPVGVGSMVAIIGLSREQVLDACAMAKDEGVVEPANFNCPGQIVISGEAKAVEKAAAIAVELGAKRAVPLAVSAPFHCSLMAPAAEKLKAELEKVQIHEMKVPVVANVNGEVVPSAEYVRESLYKQVSNPVLWEDCVRTMVGNGVDTFVEIGPGKVLSGFVKKIDKNVRTLNVEDMSSLENTLRELR